MNAGRICTLDVVTCRADTTVLAASKLMREGHVGDVVVIETTEGRKTPIGIGARARLFANRDSGAASRERSRSTNRSRAAKQCVLSRPRRCLRLANPPAPARSPPSARARCGS
ncbi:CBS domain-containing protein [Caballeronia sp. ATUFL_M2_KS44]|uniref:CBS domain-containing protein n=1 Tax=Caballeronia sp. ATUFL_M2_KS44 TaxID=2921767 RepID=UPI0020293838|nr:CBS domain-containing protein [Caballeronia sp. ATUFL_M2_KS44]